MIPDIPKTIDSVIWGDRLSQHGRAASWLTTVLRFVYGIVRDIVYGQLTLRSMSLVYSTLLSVVPLIAFSFSVLKGLGVHQRLEPYLYKLLEPLGEQGEQITAQIIHFVDNVKGGLLGGISLAFFIYTAISMVQKVEESFNYVWYVSQPRSFARRFTDYVIVLLIGPVVMVIAIGIIASIGNNDVAQSILSSQALTPLVFIVGKLTPYLLVSAVFTFVYKYMPNTYVKLSAALVGGLAGGVIWATMGAFFTSFVVYASNRELIYSGFAVAITALIWLYLNWLVLLIGAQIAFYFQKPVFLRIGRREPRLSNAARERLSLNMMFIVGTAFREPRKSVSMDEISAALKIPTLALGPIAEGLEEAGLLITTERECLVPGRDLGRISLQDILNVVRKGGVTGSYREPSWTRAVDSLAVEIDSAVADIVADKSLAQLLDEAAAAKS